jgi:hypothetical protein
MKYAALAAAVLLGACASTPEPETAAPVDPEVKAILATVDTFLLSVGNGDKAAREAVEMVEGHTYMATITPETGADAKVIVRTNQRMIDRVTQDPFIERYWDPQVLVRGPTAQFWAPYVLHDNGAVVHCGIDAMQLVKTGGKWMIASSMFTMEPGSCDALGLPEAAGLRPMDGWKETPNG